MNKRSQPYAAFARQGRIAARSDLKLAGLSLLLATGSLFMWGPGWNVWIPLGLAILMAISWWIETSAAKANERAAAASMHTVQGAGTSSDSEPRTTTDFSLVRQDDGGEWYEYVTEFQGARTRIRIGTTQGVYEKCLPYARSLVSRLNDVNSAFETFKKEQAQLSPDWADEITMLRIDTISFVGRRRPQVAEVWFTPESGGDLWKCLLDGVVFRDLTMAD